MRTTLRLPWPPSLNSAFQVNRRRGRPILSRQAREYKEEICRLLADVPVHHGHVHLTVEAHPKTGISYDLDNLAKRLLDSLTDAEVIVDDVFVTRLVMVKRPPAEEQHVVVTVETKGGWSPHEEGEI